MGFFEKLKQGLKKTKDALIKPINTLFASRDKVDDDFFEELFDVMIMSDVGVESTEAIVNQLKERLKEKKIKDTQTARGELVDILKEIVGGETGLELDKSPTILLVIGVNGVGKTTSIGKISLM
ncbi:MAG: signal recognition particle receptor subunit alpha, partial [Clostridia bacterium]